MFKKIRLIEDVRVSKNITLPAATEYDVISESEKAYIVKLGTESVSIHKLQCKLSSS